MKHTHFQSILGVLLLVYLLTPSPVLAEGSSPNSPLVANLDTTLEPGVWHGWVMRPSSACGGYIVEVTPRRPSVNGAYVEKALVRPEFNGVEWNDVLRVQIPAHQPPLKVNVRVYQTCQLPVVTDFEAILTPGDWMGWIVGPASIDRGFIVEVTPLEPSVDGAYVERALVQEEYSMGEWQDVLRAQIPVDQPDLKVHFRVYATGRMPVIAEYEIGLEPGVPAGIRLRPSTAKGGYVIEINPRGDPKGGEFVEHLAIRPEFDGTCWYDVLRLQTPADQPSLSVQVRVYGWKK